MQSTFICCTHTENVLSNTNGQVVTVADMGKSSHGQIMMVCPNFNQPLPPLPQRHVSHKVPWLIHNYSKQLLLFLQSETISIRESDHDESMSHTF